MECGYDAQGQLYGNCIGSVKCIPHRKLVGVSKVAIDGAPYSNLLKRSTVNNGRIEKFTSDTASCDGCDENDFISIQSSTSCYGAKEKDDCYTCSDVVNAYTAKGWAYEKNKFEQCNREKSIQSDKLVPSNKLIPPVVPVEPANSCYGAREQNDCYTCDNVVNAYKAKAWAYDKNKFKQCNQIHTNSCYGARPTDDCYTCDDVVNAYKAKNWAYNEKNFDQCTESHPNSCYGARDEDDCYTCNDVVDAYKARGWAYDQNKFAQCNKNGLLPIKPVPMQPSQPIIQPVQPIQPIQPVQPIISGYTLNPNKIGTPIPCPNNKYLITGQSGDQYCVVQKPLAAQACNSIGGCQGYSISKNPIWNDRYPNAAVLVGSDPLKDNDYWDTSMKQNPTPVRPMPVRRPVEFEGTFKFHRVPPTN
jgi:hypothetical protein